MTQDECKNLDELIATLVKYHPEANVELVEKAYHFAEKAHAGQLRKSGEPYFVHPLTVAGILAKLMLDAPTIAAGLLHDTVEDCDDVTIEVIEQEFGQEVALLVDGVTKLKRLDFTSRVEQQAESIRKMILAMSKDIRVVLIKLADRTHNMRTLKSQPPESQKRIAQETLDIYAPLAHRLGVYKIKQELEDLCLRYLDPEGYQNLIVKVGMKRAEREENIRTVIDTLSDKLKEMNIHYEIDGRPKHFYSIYRKMVLQHKPFEQIFDLIAIRVLVDTVPDCYAVLGVVHTLWKQVPNRFKDYISMPKPNMYQSLHTTVVGENGMPFEVQIRTYEMHRIAEYGIAAHWRYKEGKQVADSLDNKLYWLRQILDWQNDTRDSEEFIKSLKVDLFSDEIFVFTPKGEIIDLPKGATPLDFAYRIHSAVGNKCVGAKVNGRIVTLDTPLNTGDFVEIITQQNSKGPSRDWLKIVKTAQAKAKIRQFYKKELKDENIANGRSAFDAELRHCGIAMKDVLDPEFLPVLLKKVAYPTLDDLYAAIGYGGFTAQKAVSRIQGELQRRQQQRQQEQMLAEAVTESKEDPKPADTPKQPKAVKSEQGIIVEGLDNCLVKFSKCCTPVPGDDIVGFITRGYGVSVHRADCPNASEEKRKEQPDRWIHVSWGTDTNDSYPTTIEAVCKDRLNLLLDISAALSTTKTFVLGLNSRSTEDGFAIIRIEIQIKDGAQLSTLMNKLHQISGVLQVNRPVG